MTRMTPSQRMRDGLLIALPRGGLLLLFALGCGGDADPTDPGSDSNGPKAQSVTPGAFALSLASGLEGASPSVPPPSDITTAAETQSASTIAGQSFDLGLIRATDQFFFLLSNSGGTSITGINITSSNPAFEVSPTQISELPPDTGSGSVTPVVRVTAVHGLASTGLGFEDLLPAGSNSTVVDFTGTTADSTGASIPVMLDATMTVDAAVLDIKITDAFGVVDESEGTGAALGIAEADGGIVPVVGVFGDILVENTGSVDIGVSVGGQGFLTTLSPTASVSFLAADYPDFLVLIMDGGGTVSDQSRLPILRNGLIILMIIFNDPS